MQDIVIAIDAMGGDHGLDVTVPAACAFLQRKRNKAFRLLMVGDEVQIRNAVTSCKSNSLIDSGRLEIKHASQVVTMNEEPGLALKRKKDSSMRVAINSVKEGAATAMVSAGNTGALMATARFVLKTVAGIDRPAICTTLPCIDPDQRVLVLDLGANVDSPPELLEQFAVMGMVLSKVSHGVENPKVALLNVGVEDIKGSIKIKKAAELIANTKLNYCGFVEGDELFSGKFDVIVTDGFEGNIALKSSEGTAKMVIAVLKEEFMRSIGSKLLALLARPIFKRMQARLDPRSHNGASLLGLNGIVIKSHGGTDAMGFEFAISEAAQQAKLDLVSRLGEGIERFISDV